MSMIEGLRRRLYHKEQQLNGKVSLTGYQLGRILLFPDMGNSGVTAFHALGRIITESERRALASLSTSLGTEALFELDQGLPGLTRLAQDLGASHAAEALMKVSRFAKLRIINHADLSSRETFAGLPLLAQYCFSRLGHNLFIRTREFLREGGVISYLEFERPHPDYLKTVGAAYPEVKELPGKVALALARPTEKIAEASHKFITFLAIPSSANGNHQQVTTPHELNSAIHRRTQEKEEKYAAVLLNRALLTQETRTAIYLMLGAPVVAAFLYWVNEQGAGQPVLESIFQFMTKFGVPFGADMVTYTVGIKPWLEGATRGEKARDWWRKMWTTHRPSTLLAIGTTAAGSGLSEVAEKYSGSVAGATVYGLAPFSVAMYQSWNTIRYLQKSKGLGFREAVREIFASNPAQFAIDVGAFVTLVTAISVLGYGNRLDDPIAITAIEGVLEHAVAAGLTWTHLTIGLQQYFEREVSREVEKWKEKRSLV